LDAGLVRGDKNAIMPKLLRGSASKWITGSCLNQLVEQNQIQFIWAVLSGFDQDVSLDLTHLEVTPYADGNPMFWAEHPMIQHTLASVEIVCYDSSLTLLLSKDMNLSQRFRAFFPEAVDLNEYNQTQRKRHSSEGK
jgi:hypothetical protein